MNLNDEIRDIANLFKKEVENIILENLPAECRYKGEKGKFVF
jgi:hypothetical protein